MQEFLFHNGTTELCVPCQNCRNGIMQVEPGIWCHIGPLHLSCDDPVVLAGATRRRYNLYPINRNCPWCRTYTRIWVPVEDAIKYFDKGDYVQVAFPYLDSSFRQLISGGECIACQKESFPS